MVFSTPTFLFCFLPVVFLSYRLSKNSTYRNVLLCVASLIFYAFGQAEYMLLLLLSVGINYGCGYLLMKRRSKAVLIVAIAVNLALLCLFKYAAELNLSSLTLLLGISFFTFQGLSYVIDTYRNPELGTGNFGKVFLYIAFFPRLIAGPFVKYHEIEDQLETRPDKPGQESEGFRRFIVGLSKKVLLSDGLAAVVNAIFSSYCQNGVRDYRLAWVFAISYALQIYYDFSGYSDMAIGCGLLFGFTFPENFDHPYGATSLKDFWRRWHISLSSWFKEYVYIPLGGNRKGKARTFFNRLFVFLLTGFWHGANGTYLLWGLGHGLLTGLEDLNVIPVKKLEKSSLGKVVLSIYTILAVVLLFVLFRADSVLQGLQIIGAMFTFKTSSADDLLLGRLLTPLFLFIFLVSVFLSRGLPEKLKKLSTPFLSNVMCIVLLILSVLAMAKGNTTPFIYAQF